MMNNEKMINIITVRATFNSTKYEILMPSLVKVSAFSSNSAIDTCILLFVQTTNNV